MIISSTYQAENHAGLLVAIAIWYAPELLFKWTDSIAHVFTIARSLRQMRDGGNLARGDLAIGAVSDSCFSAC